MIIMLSLFSCTKRDGTKSLMEIDNDPSGEYIEVQDLRGEKIPLDEFLMVRKDSVYYMTDMDINKDKLKESKTFRYVESDKLMKIPEELEPN